MGSRAGPVQACRGSQRIKRLNFSLTDRVVDVKDLMPRAAVRWSWCRERVGRGGGKQVEKILEGVRIRVEQRDKEPVLLKLWREGEPKRNTGSLVIESARVSHHIEHIFHFRYYDLLVVCSEANLSRQRRRNGRLGSKCKLSYEFVISITVCFLKKYD